MRVNNGCFQNPHVTLGNRVFDVETSHTPKDTTLCRHSANYFRTMTTELANLSVSDTEILRQPICDPLRGATPGTQLRQGHYLDLLFYYKYTRWKMVIG